MRVRLKTKQLFGAILMCVGIILVLMLLPYWLWTAVLGIALAVIGVMLLKSC